MAHRFRRKEFRLNRLETLEPRRLLNAITFGSRQPYPIGNNPSAVVVADVSNDGVPDILVANANGNSVSVLLGNGDGTFKATETYSVGAFPYALAVADLNGDGKADIVVADDQGGNLGGGVSILINNGKGRFKPASNISGLSFPDSVAVGDVTGDGIPDIVVGQNSGPGGTIQVIPGNGDGTFRTAEALHVPADVAAIAVADLNHDGIPDILTANRLSGSTGNVSVIRSNGDGTFAGPKTFGIYGSPNAIVVADLNNDALPDIATENSENGHNAISVLLGHGDGSFQVARNYTGFTGSGALSLAVGDLNGDGFPDLFVGSDYSLLGNGDGTFHAPVFNNLGGAFRSTIGDFNGDGRPDIVTTVLNQTARVALNTTQGIFPSITYSAGTISINGTPGEDSASVRLTDTRLVATIDFTSHSFPIAAALSLNIHLNAGNDSVSLAPGSPGGFIGGMSGNDTIVDLSSANDTFQGGAEHDSIRAGSGTDFLDGGKGADTLIGGNGKDTLQGDGGNDSLRSGLQPGLVYGNNGNDTLVARAFSQDLRGNTGNDSLRAAIGDATLSGGPGSDTLSGTLDASNPDILIGGADPNLYFVGPRDSIVGQKGSDTLHVLA